MTDRELRQLKRADLLELLIEQMKENENLKAQLAEAQAALDDRTISMEKAGSIAEASLLLNGVFQAAQAAGQQYLENIERLSNEQSAICERREAESRARADALTAETEAACRQLEEETKQRCDEMTRKAESDSKAYWDKVHRQLEEFCSTRAGLQEMFSFLAKHQN